MNRALLATVILAFASGCTKTAPFRESALFENSFSAPITINTLVDSNGDIYDPQNHAQCAISQLIEGGNIKYIGSTIKYPFYALDLKTLPVNDNQVTLFSGLAKFDNSNDVQEYERGENRYFSTTVRYHIEPSAPFNNFWGKEFGPYIRRVVYVNDPAVGDWRLEGSVSEFNQQAAEAILQSISQKKCPIESIQNAKDDAYNSAMDKFAKEIADSGLLSNTNDVDILTSKLHKLAIYTGISNQRLLDGVLPESFASTAQALCEKIKSPQYHWRLPTASEFRAFTRPAYGRQGVMEFVNTPDRRFWKGVEKPAQNGTGDYFVLNTNEPPYRMPKIIFGTDGAMVETTGQFVSGYPRVICVSDLGKNR